MGSMFSLRAETVRGVLVRTNKTKSRHARKRDGFLQTPFFDFYGVFTTTFEAELARFKLGAQLFGFVRPAL